MNKENTGNRKIIFIGAAVVALAIIGVVIILLQSKTAPTNTAGTNGTYVDPNSHETVSNPAGKAPDTAGSDPNAPIYLGISKFLDYGVSTAQMDDLKRAYYLYTTSKNPHIKEVSIGVDGIVSGPHDESGATITDTLTFSTTFDRKTTYTTKFVYYDIDSARLYLYDAKTKALVFDSGNISPAINTVTGD